MSTKITNNLKVHGESTTQKYTDAQYNTDTQRINGAQPGTPISSKLMNTGLRNATLVTSALIDALKTVVPNDNDLTTAITVGTATTHTALVTALTEALVKIKVETAVLADNVKSGAIVEETTTARESKQGYGISLGLNSKLQFKPTWIGTHKNNDVLYYSPVGTLRGFYIVKGLSEETSSQTAGTLTITSGQNPSTSTLAANLQRLTFETDLGSNVNYTKTDTVNNSSTINQIPSAKAVFTAVNAKTNTYDAIVIPSGDYFVSGSNVRTALFDRLSELDITLADVLTLTFSVVESYSVKHLGSFTFSSKSAVSNALNSSTICIPTCKKDFSGVVVVRIEDGIVQSDNLESNTGIMIAFTYTK